MSTWIIPYVDLELGFWQEVYARHGSQIREVYFPVPDRLFASGRGAQPEEHLHAFLAHAPLPKAVLFNPIILAEPVEAVTPRVLGILRRLRDHYGVTGVTVANLKLAQAIKEALPEHFVSASILMGIGRPDQALIAGDSVDAVTADNRLIRDLRSLQELRRAFRGELRLIVNEACLPGCLYRTQHFYEMGYSKSLPQSLCQEMLDERPWLRLTGAWILPRHLRWYDGLHDCLKLAGRVTLRDPERYLQVLGDYVHRRPILPRDIGGGPASPQEPIDVTDEWFEYVLHCDKRCDTCQVCRDQYELALERAR